MVVSVGLLVALKLIHLCLGTTDILVMKAGKTFIAVRCQFYFVTHKANVFKFSYFSSLNNELLK